MITLIVLIMGILIICPMIGAYIAFFKPYSYVRDSINTKLFILCIHFIKNSLKEVHILLIL